MGQFHVWTWVKLNAWKKNSSDKFTEGKKKSSVNIHKPVKLLNIVIWNLMDLECSMAWCLEKIFWSLFYLVTNVCKSYTVLLVCPGQIHAVILLNSDIWCKCLILHFIDTCFKINSLGIIEVLVEMNAI